MTADCPPDNLPRHAHLAAARGRGGAAGLPADRRADPARDRGRAAGRGRAPAGDPRSGARPRRAPRHRGARLRGAGERRRGRVDRRARHLRARERASRTAPRPPTSSPSSRRSPSGCSSSSARARASAAPATPCRCTRWSPIPRSIRPTPFRRVLNRVLDAGGAPLLLYGGTQGDPRCARCWRSACASAGIAIDADEHRAVSRREPGHLARAAPVRGAGRRDRRRGAHLPQRALGGDAGSGCAPRRSRCARTASTSPCSSARWRGPR